LHKEDHAKGVGIVGTEEPLLSVVLLPKVYLLLELDEYSADASAEDSQPDEEWLLHIDSEGSLRVVEV